MPASRPDLLAPPADHEPEEFASLRRYLDGEGALPAMLSDESAEALVDALVRKGDGERLAALGASKDKQVAKQARRGIHLLKTRGVKVQEAPVDKAPAPAFAGEPEEEVPSLITAPLRDGDRGIWYTWTTPSGWVQICQVTTSERLGIERFQRFRASRKQWRATQRSIEAESKLPMVRVPTAYARWLLEEAYRKSLSVGRQAREYAEARPSLTPPVPVERHPGMDVASEEDVRAVRDPERALDLPEADSWIPDEESLRGIVDELRAAADSPLVLDERQRLERQEEVVKRHVARALDDAATGLRDRLTRRLLDLAYFLTRAALQEGPRATRNYHEEATLAVAAAFHFQDPDVAAGDNRVARRLYTKVLDKLDALKPAADEGAPPAEPGAGGLLVTP